MARTPFEKFIKTESGAKKKERIRQDKKKVRQESKAYFDKKKEEARALREQREAARNAAKDAGYSKKALRDWEGESGPEKREAKAGRPTVAGDKKEGLRKGKAAGPQELKPKLAILKKGEGAEDKKEAAAKVDTSIMPLNKYIAHAGICSRRDAAELVKGGKVTVNNTKILEPGFKVSGKDEIKVQGKKITARRNLVYILLNKPKDFITTTEDDRGRKTVLDIVKNATAERVYPVGRLDRNTTGVLLLTNDGELAQKLSHPSYEIKKIYEVTLDRQLTKADFDRILNGITLEDGFIAPDVLAWPDSKNKHIVGVEIHSGRNRIVRRIFEHLGYDVKNLDRVMYANLTKKNVERGKWRFLSEKEVRLLKYLNTSYNKQKS